MKQVLIVDDNESHIRSVRAVLRGKIKVMASETSKTAMEKAAANSIDLFLIDFRLPDINGDEVLQRLREIHPRAPALFITGFPEDLLQSPHYHGEVYLTKPVFPEDLERFIMSLLGLPTTEQKQPPAEAWKPNAGKGITKEKAKPQAKERINRRKRLIEIVRLINKEPDKWTEQRLSGKFGVSRQQIGRDIAELKQMGYDLVFTGIGWKLLKSEPK